MQAAAAPLERRQEESKEAAETAEVENLRPSSSISLSSLGAVFNAEAPAAATTTLIANHNTAHTSTAATAMTVAASTPTVDASTPMPSPAARVPGATPAELLSQASEFFPALPRTVRQEH